MVKIANQEHLRRLVEMMDAVNACPPLDAYGAKIFQISIRNSWTVFRFYTRRATPYVWGWDFDQEHRKLASYPGKIEVPTFEEFATIMLHEVAHGWCYFYKKGKSIRDYPTGVDEEQVCWDVSKLVCEALGISYQGELANMVHQYYHLISARDYEGIDRLEKQLPDHLKYETR